MKKEKRSSRWTWLRRARRGQAMASYAIFTAALLGGLVTMGMKFLPDMLNAYNRFAQSLYFTINMPFP
jgi:hypothetical protein